MEEEKFFFLAIICCLGCRRGNTWAAQRAAGLWLCTGVAQAAWA